MLKPQLDALVAGFPHALRLLRDPVEVPHRFTRPRDIEVVALLSACIAYGRVDLFKPRLEELVRRLGSAPARTVAGLDARGAAEVVEGINYRFNLPADFAVLLLGMGRILNQHGSIEAVFAEALEQTGQLHSALGTLTSRLRDVELAEVERHAGPTRGLAHLLPSPLGAGAAKRLNLYLRWMVRGPDPVDFGIWKRVPASALLVPLDTHLHRLATNLGFTKRTDLSWRTAEEVTAGLRRLDPEDPVKYDFALCHLGMSGACPQKARAASCAACSLRSACRTGGRLLKRPG
ncbi:MAG: TIGR02757 family protein [Myxococcota bacterium]|nr:TIGR02757 family protein [Myxococcota bacterium]